MSVDVIKRSRFMMKERRLLFEERKGNRGKIAYISKEISTNKKTYN